MKPSITLILSLLCLAGCTDGNAPDPTTGASDPSIVFENCNVISMVDDQVLEQQSVVVSGDVITAIAPADRLTLPSDVERIDCAGGYVLPGLTDAHVHIGDASELLLYLRYGVTTVFNLGGDYIDLFASERLDVLALRDSVARGDLPGPTIFTTGQSLDGDPATGPFQRALPSDSAAVEAVLEQQAAGYDFIKGYDNLSTERLAALVSAADDAGVPFFGHIPEAVGIDGTLASGMDVITHGEEFYPRFEDVSDLETTIRDLAAEVKAAGVYVIPNTAFIRRLALQLEDLDTQLARPDVRYLAPRVRVWWDPQYNYYTNRDNLDAFLLQTQQKYEWLLPLVAELHAQGVPLLTGTDASIPVALPGSSIHDELDDLVAAGLSPYEAIRTASSQVGEFAAEHLPQQTPFGTIQVGNRADMILVAQNPLDSISNLRDMEGVLVRGQWHTPTSLTERLNDATASFAG